MATTWMCDHGHHGTAKRRYKAEQGFTYRGECAGTVYSIATGEETECECECHDTEDRTMTTQAKRVDDGAITA